MWILFKRFENSRNGDLRLLKGGKGGKGGDGGAADARRAEEERQRTIRKGTDQINSTFDSGFDDAFYDTRRQDYVDYAMPQLDDQYADATKQLTYSLARNGVLDSSIRAAQEGDLQKKYDAQRQGIVDQGLNYANQSRNDVESARADLIKTLNATGDATAASQSALNQANALTQKPAYNPIGQLLLDTTSALANQADLERRGQAQYDTGLFSRRPGSSSTVVG